MQCIDCVTETNGCTFTFNFSRLTNGLHIWDDNEREFQVKKTPPFWFTICETSEKQESDRNTFGSVRSAYVSNSFDKSIFQLV